MNTSEIDITSLVSTAFDPWSLSNSRANLGDNVGTLTWNASKALARATEPCPLPAESEECFKDFVRSSGGWDDEEIAAWSHEELVALFVQWIAGDVQEAFGYNLAKDFIALANTIRAQNAALAHIANPVDAFTKSQLQVLAEFCRAQNPAFKTDRRFDYIDGKCGQNDGKIKN